MWSNDQYLKALAAHHVSIKENICNKTIREQRNDWVQIFISNSLFTMCSKKQSSNVTNDVSPVL